MPGLRTCVTALMLFSATASAEPTNFRVGAGLFQSDTNPAPDYMPDNSQRGYSLFAEMPQSDHTATRFMLYRLSDDNKQLIGYETQLMWGIGLSQPGFRIYTGPAWHRETIRVERPGASHRTFNGWGWQAGFGFQYRAITLDVAATLRDNSDYYSENKKAGLSDKPDSYISNLLISYRF